MLHWLQPHCLWFLAYCKDSQKYLLPELSTALPHTELFFREHVFFWSQSETAMPRSQSCSQSQAATATPTDTFPVQPVKYLCQQLLVTVWKQFLVIFCKLFTVVVCKQLLVIMTVWKQFLVILCKHFPANKDKKINIKSGLQL